MEPNTRNPKVDAFLENVGQWRQEFDALRSIVLDSPLTEEMKWGWPCYTWKGKNVVLIHGFKEYCALLFIKGALLQDPQGILIQQTENVQAGRQVRFTGLAEITGQESILREYVRQAVAVEQSGREVELRKNTEYALPEELLQKFEELPALRTAFEALTPGRQRAYLLHFSEPKQAKTRMARVEKHVPRILEGRGLND